jgi:hypothetical protein
MANAGVSPEIRSKLTGHQSIQMNAHYTKFEHAPLADAIFTIPAMEDSPKK